MMIVMTAQLVRSTHVVITVKPQANASLYRCLISVYRLQKSVLLHYRVARNA